MKYIISLVDWSKNQYMNSYIASIELAVELSLSCLLEFISLLYSQEVTLEKKGEIFFLNGGKVYLGDWNKRTVPSLSVDSAES